jgi:acyl carrier protein
MMPDAIRERLDDVFRSAFDLDETVDLSGFRQVSAERWDSLGHVALITALKSEFGISIDLADSMDMTSYEAAALLLAEQLELPR